MLNYLYLLTAIALAFYEALRKKESFIDVITLVNLWYGISYLIVPAVTLSNPFYLNSHFLNLAPNGSYEDSIHLTAYIVILVFYFSMLFTFKVKMKLKKQIIIQAKSDIEWEKSSILLLIISFIGFLIWIYGYDGLLNVYRNVNTIRSGVYERNTLASIARMFTDYSIVALLILYVVVRKKLYGSNKIIAMILLIISLSLSLIYTALSGGRGGFLFPLIQLYIVSILIDKKWNATIILLSPLLLIIILYGKFIFSNINMGMEYVVQYITNDFHGFNRSIKLFISNFTHPYYSLITSIKVTGQIDAPIFFLNPMYALKFFLHLFGLPYAGTISHINTFHILGIFDSNIPPGIVGLSYYNFMLPGAIITGIIYGYVLGIIERSFRNLKDKLYGIVLYSLTIDCFSQYVFNGDIRVFIQQRVALLLLIFFIILQKSRFSRKLDFRNGSK